MSKPLVACLLLTAAWLAISCHSEPTRFAGGTVMSDSGSVRISTTDFRNIEALPRCIAAERPELRIGTTDGSLMTQLFRVEGAVRLPDGRIAVLNRGTNEIRFFGATGSFMNSVGRDGEGPGEFRDPIEISVLTPDSLVVWDWALNRVSVVTVDGAFVRAFTLHPTAPNPTGRIGVAKRGRTVVIGSHEVRIPSGSGFLPQRLLLLRYDVEGVLQDTAATLPYGSVGVIDAESRMAGGPIFDARGSFATDGTNLYLADGSEPEVRVLNASLQLTRVLRWTPPDRTVTPEDVDRYRSERLEGLSGDALQLTRKRYEAVPASDQFPAVSNILVDSDGNTWVRRFQQPFFELQTWWRFDSQGAFRCALDLPAELDVVQFDSGFVIAVAKDDLGTESVVTLRLANVE
jgi:hypothetical protein